MAKYFIICILLLSFDLYAESPCSRAKVKNAEIIVPLYSHIYFGDALKPFNLTGTVVIRNIDPENSINITLVNYYDSKGALDRSLNESSILLSPFASHTFKIKESDTSGGSGASVLVSLKNSKETLLPLIESVMIGTANAQGISFTSRGVPINCL